MDWLNKGIRPELARLALARKIAAIVNAHSCVSAASIRPRNVRIVAAYKVDLLLQEKICHLMVKRLSWRYNLDFGPSFCFAKTD